MARFARRSSPGRLYPSRLSTALPSSHSHSRRTRRRGGTRSSCAPAGYKTTLIVYVRYPRATGFIRDIVPVEEDWESGAAVYDPQTGRVKVYVGRPEFVNLAAHAKKEKADDPFKYLPYRTLMVESVREAALRTAAERRAGVLFDELPQEERQEQDALSNLILYEYQALDYKLRRILVEA